MNDNERRALVLAGEAVTREGTSCAVLHGEKTVRTLDGRGISPLCELFDNEPELLRGALVADRIIGKAAAMVLVLGEVKAVYGDVMSDAAAEYLEAHGIRTLWNRRVPVIINRTGSGCCPIENSVMELDDPCEGYKKAKETVAMLRAQSQK